MKRQNLLFVWLVIFSFASLAQTKNLSLEDIFNSGKFSSKGVRGVHWLKNGKDFSFLEMDTVSKTTAVFIYNAKTKSKRKLISGAELKTTESDPPFRFTSYQWSPDEKQILFVSAPPDKQYLSRLTPAGNYFVYSLETKQLKKLTDVDVPQYNQKFSPDGKKIGFVRHNNIYVIELAAFAETQITFDGNENIINGRFDWVYEEEFGISDGWRWSPDGSKIAFWQIDQARVPEFTMTDWEPTHLNLIKMKYPKPGDQNAVAKIGVIDLTAKKTIWMNLGNNDDQYIPRMTWTNENNTLAIQRMNREQNKNELLFANINDGSTKIILTESRETWLDEPFDPVFLKNGNFIWQSDKDGFQHLYYYKNNGTLINQITKGDWEIDQFYGIDEKNNLLYYSSSEISPLYRHIYSIKLDGSKRKNITSKVTGTFSANFSSSFEYFVSTYSDIVTPMKTFLFNNSGSLITTLEENKISALSEYSLAKTAFLKFTTSDGVDLNACMISSQKLDSTIKHPVLVFTYGGPGSQVVKDFWGGGNYLWYSYLAEKGYIIFMVDNRGTGARGTAFKKITYKNLGKWEVNDQIEGAKYLSSLPFVDKDRIGIWGWSYGGYMSALAILKGADYFKAAIAVAPVTHWKFYDTIYSERFMSTPEINPDGYIESSPITHADKLKGNFLLIHGTADDNVHFQNAVNLVAALQKANKQFETMYYPNKNHGIGGGITRLNLYTKITNFLDEKLKK